MSTPAGPDPFALLLLTDGRFPSGGYAHSAGLEAMVAAGRVHDVATLETFLCGRIATSGSTVAAFAAAACATFAGSLDTCGDPCSGRLEVLDAELEARTPAPALRRSSRTLGRQLLRAMRAVRPHPGLDGLASAWPDGPHQPIALGAGAAALGLRPHSTAAAALHEAATGPATAATKLLALDPFAVHGVLVRLGPRLAELAVDAAGYAHTPAEHLPRASAPLLDVSAEDHATWEVRLFAS